MIKKYLTTLLLFIILAMSLPLSADADVLIEPRNDFFERHINDIVYLRRDFYVNSKNGFVSVMIEPGSNREIATIENGEVHQIQYTYNDNGKLWGVHDVEVPGKPYDEWKRGWVPMDDLLVVYDSISFEEDYKDEFFIYTGSVDALFEVQELVFWKWPGSGIVVGSWDSSTLTDPDMDFRAWWDEYLSYNDDDGRRWIAFPSMVKEWICLSDPANRDIPAFNPAPAPELWQPGDEQLASPRGIPLPVLIIIMVAAVAIVTAVLIRIFWKKNKMNRKEWS